MSRFFVFDCETTGVDVFRDRIVQLYVGIYDGDARLVDSFEWIINPGVPVPEEASAVHGFTDEYLAVHGHDPEAALRDALAVFSRHMGIPWIAFNLNFDLTILDQEFSRHGLDDRWGEMVKQSVKLVDPIVIDRAKDRYRKGKRTLEALATHYGVPFSPSEAHKADYDVAVTAKVALAVSRKYGKVSTEEQSVWYREWAEHLQEFYRKTDPEATVDASWPLRTKEEQ